MAGDAHAPDDEVAPPVGFGVLARFFTRPNAPQLFARIAVVVAIIADPQVDPAVTVPVGEQHRQRAVTGKVDRCRVPVAVGPHEGTRIAVISVGNQIVAKSQRRKFGIRFPRCRECRCPRFPRVDTEVLRCIGESAIPEPAQNGVAAASQNHEVGGLVVVDVERIGAGDEFQVGDRRRLGFERQSPSRRAAVDVQLRLVRTAGEEQLRSTVVVAVEGCDAATDKELELPVVDVVDARGGCLVDEFRDGGSAVSFPRTKRNEADTHDCEHGQGEQPAPCHRRVTWCREPEVRPR